MDNDTYKKFKLDFQDKYFKVIKPKLAYYEEKRLNGQKEWKKKLQILLLIFIPLVVLCLFTFSQLAFFVGFLGFVIGCFMRASISGKINCEMKQNFMPIVCDCFENLRWTNERPARVSEFHEIGLVDYYNRTSFDDIFFGNYKDVNFKIIEADLKYERNSGKNRTVTTILDGIILKIESKKCFNSHTLIRSDSLFKGAIKQLKRTELEDVIFEKKYDVYTNDEVEARVIINALFMERINNISKVFKTRSTSCAFLGNYIYIALNTYKDMFEIFNFNKPIDGAEFFAQMFEELLSIYKLIDYLQLGQKTT